MGKIIRIFFNNNRYEPYIPVGDALIDSGAAIKANVKVYITHGLGSWSQPNAQSGSTGSLYGGGYVTTIYKYTDSSGVLWYCLDPGSWVKASDVS